MTYLFRTIPAFLFLALLCSGISAQNSFQKIYDDSSYQYARRFLALPGSGYMVAGVRRENNASAIGAPWLMRLDSSGELMWRKTYPMPIHGSLEQVIRANNGGYLGVGYTSYQNGLIQQVLVIQTDADGNFEWGTSLDDAWQCYDVQPVPDGYILSGALFHFTIGAIDGILVKINNAGELVWSKHYGNDSDNLRVSFGAAAVVGDTVYVAGEFENQRAFFTVSAADGTLYSAKRYPDTVNLFNGMYAIRAVDSEHFIVGGTTYMPDMLKYATTLHRIGKDGSMTISEVLYRENESLRMVNLANAPDGNFILGCNSALTPANQRSVLIKTDAAAGITAAFRYGRTPGNFNFTLPVPDGSFVSLRQSIPSGKMVLTKTLPDMLVEGCCTAPLTIKSAELPTASEDLNLTSDDFGQFIQNYSLNTELLSFTTAAYCPPEPVLLEETLTFCPGDSVSVAGTWYSQPGTVKDTILSPAACDTIVTYFLSFTALPQTSAPGILCPADLTVDAQSGQQSAVVSYALPAATTDCPCGDAAINLVQGLPSGSDFPAGPTQVCYRTTDECGSTASCCFTVTVDVQTDEEPCDVKTTPCIQFEVLGISQNPAGQKTYRLRVTNTCSNRLVYAVFQLPDGLTADAPATNTTYTAPSGRSYAVRNANASPFYSIRFKADGAGIAGGQSDVFEYTLPPQAAPLFIHAAARLEGQGFYETHLNVFDCVVEQTVDRPSEADARSAWSSPDSRDFTVFPNPFADQLNVVFDLEETGSVQAVLTDMTGRVVFLENKNLPATGRQSFAWNTGDLPNGAYLVGLNLPEWGWTYRKVMLLR